MDNLEDTANDKLKEVAREISNELKFTSSYVEDKNIKMHKIIDGKESGIGHRLLLAVGCQ